jgi:3-hydroxyacyl-[acyl-carrier protein] dehydratase/trans-2-decenoyl-[acyl-carrier protein] isomerase
MELRPMTKDSFTREELLECGHGRLFGPGNAKLPLPPMLMVDRITKMSKEGGLYEKGFLEAEMDLHPDLWFFKCHFEGDPVMPGCLGLDALWQMVGFYMGWLGHPGVGRALGAGEIKFTNQALPHNKLIQYRIDFKRVRAGALTMGVGDGKMTIDGKAAYECNDLKVGLFKLEDVVSGGKA